MPKSADAFRTISEVADWLDIQAHVLRFWESKFTQVKPIKRAGGRRYYRPADMLLLGGIKRLLHDDGLTIKGVQKILREEGMNYVSAMSAPLDEVAQADLDKSGHDTIDMPTAAQEAAELQQPENVVLPFEPARNDAATQDTSAAQPKGSDATPVEPSKEAPEAESEPEKAAAPPEHRPKEAVDASSPPEPMAPATVNTEDASPVEALSAPSPDASAPMAPQEDEKPPVDPTPTASDQVPDTGETAAEAAEDLPTFLRRPMSEPDTQPSDNTPSEDEAPVEDTPPEPAPESVPEPAPSEPTPVLKPRIIDLPPILAEDDIPAVPRALAAALRNPRVTSETAAKVTPLLARLTVLRDSMSSGRRPAAKD